MRSADKQRPDGITGVPRRRDVRRSDMHLGDRVHVTTQNSLYRIRVLDQETYLVSGGWFDRTGCSPMKTAITGCTWDGILFDGALVAARGMRLKFGDHLLTTPIRTVRLFRYGNLN